MLQDNQNSIKSRFNEFQWLILDFSNFCKAFWKNWTRLAKKSLFTNVLLDWYFFGNSELETAKIKGEKHWKNGVILWFFSKKLHSLGFFKEHVLLIMKIIQTNLAQCVVQRQKKDSISWWCRHFVCFFAAFSINGFLRTSWLGLVKTEESCKKI